MFEGLWAHLAVICPGRPCPSPPDPATALMLHVMAEAALQPRLNQMKYSLTALIAKQRIPECHLYRGVVEVLEVGFKAPGLRYPIKDHNPPINIQYLCVEEQADP